MRITNRDWSLTVAEWEDLFRCGSNPTLRFTSGELKKEKDHFYLAGGHNLYNLKTRSKVTQNWTKLKLQRVYYP